MNTPQRVIVSIFGPLAVVALLFVMDYRPRPFGSAYSREASLAQAPWAWLAVTVGMGVLECWLWRTPGGGGGEGD